MSQLCFDALYRLFEIRKADRLEQLKTLSLFPTVDMLLDVENKYGDTVTLQDMNGAASVARVTIAADDAGSGGEDALLSASGAVLSVCVSPSPRVV